MQAVHRALNRIREIEALRSLRDLTDPELLDRFAKGHDEFAFVEIVERHAAMILGVCRRGLTCPHEAEDACQTVFLVLARSAATVRASASLGSWLHGVALRVIAKIKRSHSRRTAHERQAVPRTGADPASEVEQRETLALLDEELGLLPEKYRSALILCYLEGHSRAEAATQLRVSAGTLHGLLERGRKLLAERLTQRGVTLSASVLPSLTTTGGIQAASLAAQVAGATSTLSPVVEIVAKQILQEMAMMKLKLTALSLFGALVLLTAGVAVAQTTQPAPMKDVFTQPLGRKAIDDSDEVFLRRVCLDLRGSLPSSLEVNFFVESKDPDKRKKALDLLIQERQANAPGIDAKIAAVYRSKLRAMHQTIEEHNKDREQKDKYGPFLKEEFDLYTQRVKDADAKLQPKDRPMSWADIMGIRRPVEAPLVAGSPAVRAIHDALAKSDLGGSFKLAGEHAAQATTGEGVITTQLTLRMEATKPVDLVTFNKKHQLVLFDRQGTLLAAATIDFGASVNLEKGEAVGLKVPAVDLEKFTRAAIRPLAVPTPK